jgi:hypothetical protein
MLLGMIISFAQERRRTSTELAEANRLYSHGNREEAVAIYKSHVLRGQLGTGAHADHLTRIIQHEVKKQDTREAVYWLLWAREHKVELTLDDWPSRSLNFALGQYLWNERMANLRNATWERPSVEEISAQVPGWQLLLDEKLGAEN